MIRTSLLVGCVVFIAACHQDEPDYYAWDRLMASDEPITVDFARSAFVIAFAPLPGVKTPPGKTKLILDGTLVLDWMDYFMPELTDSQRQVVAELDAETLTPLSLPRKPAAVPVDTTVTPEINGWIETAAATISIQTGMAKPNIKVRYSKVFEDTATALAGTHSRDAANNAIGPAVRCNIGLNKNFFAAYRGGDQTKPIAYEAIAHEVFHCYQHVMFPTLGDRRERGAWFMEGSATWAAAAITGHAKYSDIAWQEALDNPQRALFKRKYDAVGFFTQLDREGLSPWIRTQELILAFASAPEAAKDDAALAAATKNAPDFFYRWATSFFRDVDLDGEWNMNGVDLPPRKEPPTLAVAPLFLTGGVLGPGGANPANLVVSADVIILRSSPDTRLFRLGATDVRAPFANYCTLTTGCDCPAGSPHAGEIFASLMAGDYRLSLGGGSGGAAWMLAGFDKDDYCEADKVDPCLLGSWTLDWSTAFSNAMGLCIFDRPLGANLTIDQSGAFVIDLNPTEDIDCSSGSTTILIKMGGKSVGQFTEAFGGLAFGASDDSGLTVETTTNGVSSGPKAFSSLFAASPSILGSSGVGRYKCSSKTLEWTVHYSTLNTYTRP